MQHALQPDDDLFARMDRVLRSGAGSMVCGVAIAALLVLAIARGRLLSGLPSTTITSSDAERAIQPLPLAGLTPLPAPLPAAVTPHTDAASAPAAAAGNRAAEAAALAQSQEQATREKEAIALQKQQLDAEAAQIEASAAAQKKAADDAAAQLNEQRKAMDAANAARAEAEAARVAAKPPPYDGPASGDIVWEGPVSGETQITITGGSSDVGQIVSGKLPGVHILLTPQDKKRVRVAAPPSPSNGYKRLVLGATGKGDMRITVHWSLP